MSNDRKGKKPPTLRQRRVAEEIRHFLGNLFNKRDFVIVGFPNINITVTEVSIGPDLRNATAYLSSIDKETLRDSLKMINKNHGFFRKELSRALPLKYVPSLHFKYDDRLDQAEKINVILSEIQKSE